jgi:hypothetical protein
MVEKRRMGTEDVIMSTPTGKKVNLSLRHAVKS